MLRFSLVRCLGGVERPLSGQLPRAYLLVAQPASPGAEPRPAQSTTGAPNGAAKFCDPPEPNKKRDEEMAQPEPEPEPAEEAEPDAFPSPRWRHRRRDLRHARGDTLGALRLRVAAKLRTPPGNSCWRWRESRCGRTCWIPGARWRRMASRARSLILSPQDAGAKLSRAAG